MMTYIDVTGKSEDEAISKALAQLGLERDDVSVEILERAKSGFLGIGGNPAKVRVSYEAPEDFHKAEKVVEKPVAPAPQKVEKAHQKVVSAPKEPKQSPVSAPVVEKSAPQVDAAPKAEKAPATNKEEAIVAFLDGLMEQLEVSATVEIAEIEKGRYDVKLVGENLGAIIGRRGETLDAIQQLTSYAVNREGGRVRIQLDAENYRAKREQALENLAKKVAGKVVKYHRNVTLEPMNAYERHVIHAALQDIEGISTYSTGTDPNRRVIVALKKN
ncbi:RNA-binding cell elongation regulator Jag/EloR [Bengtsoniella intestinalis]|uniref:RNA-binding cell elongation regulator Jag/EloR n=1 Tax=Bengtsoniella intestinalis TaxID=3073143 RepID=UPI00391EF264